ncbi:conserved hypothetical protein [Leishmania infantum JPCM5]|uniref:Uncharacterized protein n=2 Tax=Leishmania infantum TaxID=5671 RepID=A4I2D1_LEIIN|nr:conserved hypothetical protein [Leishmania infantum JPCM5]CAM68920.1 conserved hypothetical protein [Leishmania infantum JPCM5]|eukprot:XP_001470542.1 conserved hypothetical protein [Leishmania infantum JPCM5]
MLRMCVSSCRRRGSGHAPTHPPPTHTRTNALWSELRMLRRTWLPLMSLTEAQHLVLDAQGQQTPTPRAPLPQLLAALAEHYRAGCETFTKAALQHVVQLDQSDEDTRHIAAARLVAPLPPNCLLTDVNGAPPHTAAPPKAPPHLITEVLRAYPHTPEVRERCCRCIANMCQLSADASTSIQLVPAACHSGTPATSTLPLADALVEEGAVELVLGTLAIAGRLSSKGRCWTAMAMLNLTCMSHNGAARATAAGAVDRLAEFVLFLLEDAPRASAASTAAPIRGLVEEATIALDAALGALTGVLAAEAPENASSISFNYEKASYVAVDAVVRSLLAASALMVRDGRNNGAYDASLLSRRCGTVHFSSASETQQTAVAVLLPLLHKGWMALQSLCSFPANLPMVFDVIYEAANANQESMAMANETDGGTEEVLQVTGQTERQYVAALSCLVDAALFLTTELEGLEAVGTDKLACLQNDIRLYVMDVMQAMTASRKDLTSKDTAAASASAGGAGEDAEEEARDSATADTSPVYPTAAAMSVTDVLTAGTVSNMALACAVRLHIEHQERRSRSEHQDRHSTCSAHSQCRRGVPTPYAARDLTLLSKSLAVLANAAEIGDEAATSANAVAALQAILQDAAEGVMSLPPAYGAELAELFRPTENAEDNAEVRGVSGIHPEDRLSFLQQAALVGQVYAVLWSTLRTAQGVATVSQMSVMQTAKGVQTSLRESYLPALAAARERFGARPAADAGDEAAKPATVSWVANTAEETVTRLLKLSDELISNMQRLSESTQRTPA